MCQQLSFVVSKKPLKNVYKRERPRNESGSDNNKSEDHEKKVINGQKNLPNFKES